MCGSNFIIKAALTKKIRSHLQPPKAGPPEPKNWKVRKRPVLDISHFQNTYRALPDYLLLTEPAAVGAWFWRWRSRPMWSVAPDTLQSASDWSSGPGWFRHYQRKLGQTGVGVGEPVLRLLRRDDPSQLCNQVSGVPSQYDTRAGFVPVGCPVAVEPGTRVLRPAGLSPAEQISDNLGVW